MNLTSDTIAHAMIAAAACMPGDATTALQIVEQGRYPAAVALAMESKRPLTAICAILGCGPLSVADARYALPDAFKAAQDAARAAIKVQRIAGEAHTVEPAPAPAPPPVAPPAAPVVVREPAPLPVVAKRPPPGPISSIGFPEMSSRVVPMRDRSLRSDILVQLADAPSTAGSLCILCDAKEMAVTDTLRGLEREGLVEQGPVPSQGKRYCEWRLTARDAAAGDAA